METDISNEDFTFSEHSVTTVIQSPFDMDPTEFSEGLKTRKQNRELLAAWIEETLKDKIDFGRIHLMPKSKCSVYNCTNPNHLSKPSMFKPGAEKICQILGVSATFPNLEQYEQAAIEGKSINHIILRCELVGPSGAVFGSGVGARDVAKECGDLNKAFKMAEKSAQIDATLRMAGLSELFTQDLEDMTVQEPHKTVFKNLTQEITHKANEAGMSDTAMDDWVHQWSKGKYSTIANVPPEHHPKILKKLNEKLGVLA